MQFHRLHRLHADIFQPVRNMQLKQLRFMVPLKELFWRPKEFRDAIPGARMDTTRFLTNRENQLKPDAKYANLSRFSK